MIVSTGVIGAEQFIRSIGILVGGYPNELEMMDNINKGIPVEMKPSYFVYFILIALFAAGGTWFQFRLKGQDEEKQLGQDYLNVLAKKKGAEINEELNKGNYERFSGQQKIDKEEESSESDSESASDSEQDDKSKDDAKKKKKLSEVKDVDNKKLQSKEPAESKKDAKKKVDEQPEKPPKKIKK